jgi:hypothetical protein
MDTDQFLMELLKAVHSTTQAITELRRVLDSQSKDNEVACNNAQKTLDDVEAGMKAAIARLDGIATWQKIKLPFIIGTITLVLYGIGFFFTLNRVAGMIEVRHVSAISATHP